MRFWPVALVSRVRNSFTNFGDTFQDFFSGGCPNKWLWVSVVVVEVFRDRLFQTLDAAKRAAADAFFGNLGEESFHLIEPRTVGGNKVQVIGGVALEPALHF